MSDDARGDLTNDGGHVIRMFESPNGDEMEALDTLGPLTRAMIYDSPIRFSAAAILKQFRDFEEKQRAKFPEHVRHRFHLDPADPRLDQMIAEQLPGQSLETIRKDRSEEEAQAGVKPLRANVSVKSIREQRRSARRVRW